MEPAPCDPKARALRSLCDALVHLVRLWQPGPDQLLSGQLVPGRLSGDAPAGGPRGPLILHGGGHRGRHGRAQPAAAQHDEGGWNACHLVHLRHRGARLGHPLWCALECGRGPRLGPLQRGPGLVRLFALGGSARAQRRRLQAGRRRRTVQGGPHRAHLVQGGRPLRRRRGEPHRPALNVRPQLNLGRRARRIPQDGDGVLRLGDAAHDLSHV